jgi:hypothetical protein
VQSRGWVWFFVVLAILSAVAIGVQVWFNLRQQLTRDQLEAARALWKEKGPADYDLQYTKKGSVSGTFEVRVRGGRVVSATMDGQPLERRLYAFSDMPGLFDDLERFLEMDSAPGSPRTFTKATFDMAGDGHLIHYIRSVMSTRQRVEINVRLNRVSPDAKPDAGR